MTKEPDIKLVRPASELARLVPRDVLRLDADQRARHLMTFGGEASAEVMAHTREELGHRLHTATVAHNGSAKDELANAARRIRRLAVRAGFPDLARAADSVLDCIVQEDDAALGATVARMHRLGILVLRDGYP